MKYLGKWTDIPNGKRFDRGEKALRWGNSLTWKSDNRGDHVITSGSKSILKGGKKAMGNRGGREHHYWCKPSRKETVIDSVHKQMRSSIVMEGL